MSTLSQFMGGTITGYTQSTTYTSSQTVTVPVGTKRIEALLCGGGGGGSYYFSNSDGGGGFGGLQIYNIPITGSSLVLVVGAGGARNIAGGTTSVSAGGTMYAAVGGGGSEETGDALRHFRSEPPAALQNVRQFRGTGSESAGNFGTREAAFDDAFGQGIGDEIGQGDGAGFHVSGNR